MANKCKNISQPPSAWIGFKKPLSFTRHVNSESVENMKRLQDGTVRSRGKWVN